MFWVKWSLHSSHIHIVQRIGNMGVQFRQESSECKELPYGVIKGMCGGPRCTIFMHVNAYDL